MQYLKNNKIKEFVIDILQHELNKHIGLKTDDLELGYIVCDEENMTFGKEQAKEWIKKNFDYLGEIAVSEGEYFCKETLSNTFNNPAKVMSLIIAQVAVYLIGQCDMLVEYFGKRFTLTYDMINQLKLELLEQSDIDRTKEILELKQTQKQNHQLKNKRCIKVRKIYMRGNTKN